MNEVQIEKKVFVDSYLAPLLVFATDGEIRFAKYLVSGADERVEIRFANGYTKSVNVTLDSLPALARDVLKQV